MEPQAVKSNVVLILDYGSQYTHLITRRIRSLSVFSLCINGTSSLKSITELSPSVIILSGGPHSVHAPNAPCFPLGFIEYVESNGVYVLGICYGMQLLVQNLGGKVTVGEKQEYGRMKIVAQKKVSELYGNKEVGDEQIVWMSHGDEAVKLPEGFEVVARSEQGSVAAVEHKARRFYGLQYHPEVTHTPEGMETLKQFLFNVCGVSAKWNMEDVLEEEIKVIKGMVGTEDHVICALSGVVDSAVAATLVHKAIGDRLHCIFVDNGLLRYKEQERVMETFKKDLHLPVTCVDATEAFLSKLKGVTDLEIKRKIIGKEFISIFDEFAHKLEQTYGKKPTYLVQGTLYPDVIESCPPPGSGRTHSHTIKSHHNVGGLPKDMKLKFIEPLKLLFKDEVRELGRILNVPVAFLKRHPFPGPGLAVRVLGDVTEGNALEILRQNQDSTMATSSKIIFEDSDVDASSSDDEGGLPKELADVTFGELQRARSDGTEMVYLKSNSEKTVPGRANKNRPVEMSSKKPVKRFREVIQAPKKVVRDPRYEDLSGTLDVDGFKKRYHFLYEKLLPAEKENLRKQMKKTKDAEAKDELKTRLKWIDKQLKSTATKNPEKEILDAHKKKEREAAKQGKQPYYLKKSDIRKQKLIEKYKELKESGKLESFMQKKRKKNASKDVRYMPYRRATESVE